MRAPKETLYPEIHLKREIPNNIFSRISRMKTRKFQTRFESSLFESNAKKKKKKNLRRQKIGVTTKEETGTKADEQKPAEGLREKGRCLKKFICSNFCSPFFRSAAPKETSRKMRESKGGRKGVSKKIRITNDWRRETRRILTSGR